MSGYGYFTVNAGSILEAVRCAANTSRQQSERLARFFLDLDSQPGNLVFYLNLALEDKRRKRSEEREVMNLHSRSLQ